MILKEALLLNSWQKLYLDERAYIFTDTSCGVVSIDVSVPGTRQKQVEKGER